MHFEASYCLWVHLIKLLVKMFELSETNCKTYLTHACLLPSVPSGQLNHSSYVDQMGSHVPVLPFVSMWYVDSCYVYFQAHIASYRLPYISLFYSNDDGSFTIMINCINSGFIYRNKHGYRIHIQQTMNTQHWIYINTSSEVRHVHQFVDTDN